jgi:cell division protein FtsW
MRTTSLVLLLTVSLLLALSITMLSSAVMLDKNFLSMVTVQAGAILAGIGAMCLLWWIDYRRLLILHWWSYGLAVLLLLLVVSPLGTYRNGAQRWLFGIQPAEFAKISLLLTLTAWCARNEARIRLGKPGTTFVWGFLLPGLLVLPLLALLYKQPDRGTLMLFGLVTVVLLLLAGMHLGYAGIAVGMGGALGVHFYNSSEMVRKRLDAFLHPELYKETTGSQALKSLAALREGGVHGTGLGSGVIKLSIPEQHTDFILPVIGEELGLVFTLAVLSAFVVILLCAVRIASRTGDPAGRLLAGGIGFLIAGQAVINIAVVTNSMINKGMPLPFVSRGGSSMVAMLALIGLLLSIARQTPDASEGAQPVRHNPFNEPDLETLPSR